MDNNRETLDSGKAVPKHPSTPYAPSLSHSQCVFQLSNKFHQWQQMCSCVCLCTFVPEIAE